MEQKELRSALKASEGSQLEIEIGCGSGTFLTNYASRQPNSVFVGIDLKKNRCEKTRAKLRRHGLVNAFVINRRAEEVIEELRKELSAKEALLAESIGIATVSAERVPSVPLARSITPAEEAPESITDRQMQERVLRVKQL